MKKQHYSIVRMILATALILVLVFCTTGCQLFLPSSRSNKEEVLLVDGDKPIKVLQFADLHFGVEGSDYHNSDVERSLEFIDYAITSEKPDFIVLLGDNMMSQGVEGARFIVETFDKYKIPYTYVFGNHDAELYSLGYSKAEVSSYLEGCDSPYLLYKSGYVQPGKENRYGNFSISIRDEDTNELIGAFVVLDTGVYDYSEARYQSINEGQIDWYNQEIEALNDLYLAQQSAKFDTIPSITYGHIQLPEYADAYTEAKEGDGASFVYEQEIPDWMIEAIRGDAGEINYGFFDAMKNKHSARAYFCGHMHGLTLHVEKDDILLGFCPQACVTGDPSRTIRTFSYTIDENFEISLNLISEPQS